MRDLALDADPFAPIQRLAKAPKIVTARDSCKLVYVIDVDRQNNVFKYDDDGVLRTQSLSVADPHNRLVPLDDGLFWVPMAAQMDLETNTVVQCLKCDNSPWELCDARFFFRNVAED
jgi:hypothetical protein